MALHDSERNILRTMACGIAGLSVVADSLSAIKYAKVKPIRDENGISIDFIIEGDYPKFGNDDDKVDEIAKDVLNYFYNELKNIFVKYNIILNEKKFEIENVEECINLLEEIKKIEEFDLEYKDIISKIEAKKAYKNFLHGKDNQLKDIKKTILQRSKKVKIVTKESKYKPFLESKRYTMFTGIDEKFFKNIL